MPSGWSPARCMVPRPARRSTLPPPRRATSRWPPASWRTRRGVGWTTIEEPLKLSEALEKAVSYGQPVLVDCLTLWLSNLMHAGEDVDQATDELVQSLDDHNQPVVFVSNELGLGLVPETPLGRSFRDAMGRMNMRIAERSDRVVFMAAGLPLLMKDRPAPRR